MVSTESLLNERDNIYEILQLKAQLFQFIWYLQYVVTDDEIAWDFEWGRIQKNINILWKEEWLVTSRIAEYIHCRLWVDEKYSDSIKHSRDNSGTNFN